jgi:hypothetical protein
MRVFAGAMLILFGLPLLDQGYKLPIEEVLGL